jgi:glycerophosphoryl diester phosphodiesterase
MLDRATFLRPIAHRGLHAAAQGVVENSGPAFEAAIGRGYGIECDLRPAADGTPMVFHDVELGRLLDAPGTITERAPAELVRLVYRGTAARILRLADLLDLVAGRVPLLIEVKSEWQPPEPAFLGAIARLVLAYRGPAALMSFDPAVIRALRDLAPGIPRGIVSGLYTSTWWPRELDSERAWRLSHLIDSGPAAPHFFAYHVTDLPTPVTRFLREGLGLPLFAWTVRTAAHVDVARQWADAPIFEDVDPST